MNGIKSLLAALMTIAALCVTTCVGFAQANLTVRIDTLFVEGDEVVIDGYPFSLYNNHWHISILKPDPTVLYEDDIYTVRVEDYHDIIFTEKQPSWYIDSHNGWPQYEYVNRQYYFPENFHQILRHGNYYYFVYDNKVDSLRIDQSPGNPLVKNTLPDILDVNDIVHKAKWCDPKSGYGSGRLWWRGYICHHGCCIGSHRTYPMPVDTIFRGAFVANDQLYFVVNYGKEMFIAQRNGDDMSKILSLGQGGFYDGEFYWQHQWRNLGPSDNRLQLPFFTPDGTAGLLTIDGSDIHIRYVMSPTTVMP